MHNRDSEWEWKKWITGAGQKVEDGALAKIRSELGRIYPGAEAILACAIHNAILEGWEAGWGAAGGDDRDD